MRHPNFEGGVGVVSRENEDGSIDISWVLGGSDKNVCRERLIISLDPLAVTAQQRTLDNVDRPSLLAPYHQPLAVRTLYPVPPSTSQRRTPRGVSKVLLKIESRSWRKEADTEEEVDVKEEADAK